MGKKRLTQCSHGTRPAPVAILGHQLAWQGLEEHPDVLSSPRVEPLERPPLTTKSTGNRVGIPEFRVVDVKDELIAELGMRYGIAQIPGSYRVSEIVGAQPSHPSAGPVLFSAAGFWCALDTDYRVPAIGPDSVFLYQGHCQTVDQFAAGCKSIGMSRRKVNTGAIRYASGLERPTDGRSAVNFSGLPARGNGLIRGLLPQRRASTA
jgi:hypothetical protein